MLVAEPTVNSARNKYCGHDQRIVVEQIEGTDMVERSENFQLIVERIKVKEADLVRRIVASGVDAYEQSEIGARDWKTYEREMVGVRFDALKEHWHLLSGPGTMTLSNRDWQYSRVDQAGVAWETSASGAV
jgi:hypothetical protein